MRHLEIFMKKKCLFIPVLLQLLILFFSLAKNIDLFDIKSIWTQGVIFFLVVSALLRFILMEQHRRKISNTAINVSHLINFHINVRRDFTVSSQIRFLQHTKILQRLEIYKGLMYIFVFRKQ